jgi:hypothetical protein
VSDNPKDVVFGQVLMDNSGGLVCDELRAFVPAGRILVRMSPSDLAKFAALREFWEATEAYNNTEDEDGTPYLDRIRAARANLRKLMEVPE